MSSGYLLSVDLGTSHTVAVIQWPDGRTRPLLFDGSPIMPSAVFLDQAGEIHTGRDAETLAATEPDRYEPNPKQRINDGFILLGDRDISVTQAFTAILRRVGAAAQEAVGSLPASILTCPAEWGERRRAVLQDAAAAAGYPPVKIIPEPVGAAYYYASRLENPVRPGQALAVFDFGGGTLDIAVVGHDEDGSFRVKATGGLADLGGLDVDSALVEHLGKTVAESYPEAWEKLLSPSTATQLRDRRKLWKDVREAKEMLSRSSVAPITIPGIDQAFHLTRNELDQMARPLLARGVGELQRVLGSSGYSPDKIVGVFLVGGSSRLPLVAQVLHEGINMAPTVLEQPELPVSEGAIAAVLAQDPPTTPQSPPSGQSPMTPPAAQPVTPQSLPPQTPGMDSTYPIPTQPKPAPKKSRKALAGAVAGILVLALVAGLTWFFLFREHYEQRDFNALETVGDPLFHDPETVDWHDVVVRGDVGYIARVEEDSNAQDQDRLTLVAQDLKTGEEKWQKNYTVTAEEWGGLSVGDGLLTMTRKSYVDNECCDEEYTRYFFDVSDGEVLKKQQVPNLAGRRVNDEFLFVSVESSAIALFDRKGEKRYDDDLGELSVEKYNRSFAWDDYSGRNSGDATDGRFWWLTDDEMLHVFNTENAKMETEKNIGSVDDAYTAFDGTMFVGTNTTGYEVRMYDMDEGLSSLSTARVSDSDAVLERIEVCGKTLVCFMEKSDESDDEFSFRVYDFKDEEEVYNSADDDYTRVTRVEAVGDRILFSYKEGDNTRSIVLDDEFQPLNQGYEGSFSAIDDASALTYSKGSDSDYLSSRTGTIVGVGLQDGARKVIKENLEVFGDCDANDVFILCMLENGSQVYRFRDGDPGW
ncbi:Hsp70 family protein [Salininema proteolyticum]|uniref:Hsp70 family protein n=1 Tax=Salininema proteolyticum TaxID=1607685 RepID=A0ABV8U3S8_9ACTN